MSTGVASLFDRDCVSQTHSTFYDWSCGRVLSHPPHLTSTSNVNATRPACDIPPLAGASFQVCCVATILSFMRVAHGPYLPHAIPHMHRNRVVSRLKQASRSKSDGFLSAQALVLTPVKFQFIFFLARVAVPCHTTITRF